MSNLRRVFITEPLPKYELAFKLIGDQADVEVSEVFYDIVPSEKLKHCVATIVGDSRITGESLAEADELLLIQKFGVGLNTIDTAACSKKGICVCNLPGVNALDVAEYVVGGMISFLRGFLNMDRAARIVSWDERPNLIGERLSGKTVGIIGFGNIGREVSRLLQPFEAKIFVYDKYVSKEIKKEFGVVDSELNVLLRESDIVTIHVPLTDETVGLISDDEFEIMKPSAVLINASRGKIVDENALCRALESGKIRGAIIDVYAEEPPKKDNPLFKLRNTQLSIHTAGWTKEAFEESMRSCSKNIIRVLKGEIPENIANNPQDFGKLKIFKKML